MNLQSTDFELFGLPTCFEQNRAALDARWKDLQREVHPDRFAAQGGAAQRLAMQWSVRINEAYQRLKDPLRRAAYLCELQGARVNAEDNTAMPAAFLMQQMQWRELLEEASGQADLDNLLAQVTAARGERLRVCAELIDRHQNFPAAVQEVRSLMFLERFLDDVRGRLDQMDTDGANA